jgi:hypothetical protein
MKATNLVAAACLAFVPIAAFADDLDNGWAVLSEIFSLPDKPIDKDRCDLVVTLNYDKYLERMGDIREAWLYKDNSVEYYQRRSYHVLATIARKEATVLTQALFAAPARRGIQSCRFRLFATSQDKYGNDRPFVILSWRFNSQLASKVKWHRLDDRNFPDLAIDYRFSPEFERRLNEDLPR